MGYYSEDKSPERHSIHGNSPSPIRPRRDMDIHLPNAPPKTNKKGYPPKRGPRWPHKASKMSQDEIWGPFWVQNGVQNGPQNCQKNDLAETLIFDTPLKPNQSF